MSMTPTFPPTLCWLLLKWVPVLLSTYPKPTSSSRSSTSVRLSFTYVLSFSINFPTSDSLHLHCSYPIKHSFLYLLTCPTRSCAFFMTALVPGTENHAWYIVGAHQILTTSSSIIHLCIFQNSSTGCFLNIARLINLE